MARLPKFLNISAARRMRLELPAAKTALIAFSVTLVVVGVGAFVVMLPSLTAVVVPATSAEAQATETTSDEAAEEIATDAATTEGDAQAAVGPSAAAGVATGTNSHSTRNGSSHAASGSGGGSSSSTSSSGASSNSGSTSSSSSSSSSSDFSAENEAANANNPFKAVPTDAEEQDFHSFLCGWYNNLAACEAQAQAGESGGS